MNLQSQYHYTGKSLYVLSVGSIATAEHQYLGTLAYRKRYLPEGLTCDFLPSDSKPQRLRKLAASNFE